MISLYLFIYSCYIIIVQMDEVLRSSGLNYAFQGIILTWMSFLKKVLLFYLKNDYLFLIFIFKRGVDVFLKYIYIYIWQYSKNGWGFYCKWNSSKWFKKLYWVEWVFKWWKKIMTCVERKFLKNIILSLLLVNVFKWRRGI